MSRERVSCPHCATNLQVESVLLGKKAKCPKCSKSFILEQEVHPEQPLSPFDEISFEEFQDVPQPSPPRSKPLPAPPVEKVAKDGWGRQICDGLIRVGWLLSGLLMFGAVLAFPKMMNGSQSAIQQAAAAAIGARNLIAPYVIMRAFEGVLRRSR